jgi:hypothetical protein
VFRSQVKINILGGFVQLIPKIVFPNKLKRAESPHFCGVKRPEKTLLLMLF